MKKIFLVSLLSLTPLVCMGQIQPGETLTLGDVQGRCFQESPDFLKQTSCILNTVDELGLAPNSYAQDYLANVAALRERVEHRELSGNQARAQLTARLSELRSLQQNEGLAQQQIENGQAASTAAIIHGIKPNMLELPQRRSPILTNPIQTTCQQSGSQVNCTSRR